jgi:hypothetical protein
MIVEPDPECRSGSGLQEASMFKTFLIACGGFIAGAVLTYLVVVFGTVFMWDMTGVHDQDGGGAMALGLVIGPFLALIGGIVCAALTTRWAVRRNRNAPPQSDQDKARDSVRFFVIGGAILGGIIGHYAAQIGFYFVSPISLDSFWIVQAIIWIPRFATLLGAVGGGLLVWRKMRYSF